MRMLDLGKQYSDLFPTARSNGEVQTVEKSNESISIRRRPHDNSDHQALADDATHVQRVA